MIAEAVLGPKRAKGWASIVKFLEQKDHFPPIDKQMGGRYWPAVVAYFHQRANLHIAARMPANSRIRIMPPPPDSY